MSLYFGQYGQDSVIDSFFQEIGQSTGTFLDVGASDGIRFSNSYFLEVNRGWKGICVEAHPDYFELLKKNRQTSINYGVAVGNKDGADVDIRLNYRASLTSLDLSLDEAFSHNYQSYYAPREISEVNGFRNGIQKVKMRTIDSIIEENIETIPSFDVIMIDIDGSEKFALSGFNLGKWKPRVLLIEHSVVGHNFVNAFANAFGYKNCITLGSDNFYVQNDHDLEIIKKIVPSKNLANIKHPAEM